MDAPETSTAAAPHRAGFAGLFGRPNVGKSTLLNQLVGAKLAAVADKPQTTRHRIVGIVTRPEAQVVLVDTPGIHAAKAPLNARMVAVARQALGDTDVAVLVVDAVEGMTAADREVAAELPRGRPTLVAVTKIDAAPRAALLVACARAQEALPDAAVVPVSGLTGDNVDRLLALVAERLPPGPALYPEDQVSEQSERFLAGEIVREQIVRRTRNEVPYATAVQVTEFREEPDRDLLVIEATILVERATQKGIVIGEGGQRIRALGTAARHGLEHVFGCRVFLDLHVRVQPGWSKNPRVLQELGL